MSGAVSGVSLRCSAPRRPAPAVAGIAQRIFLAASTRANGHHEAVRFHHTTTRCLDSHRTRHQHRAVGHHLYPGGGHRLSARITTISSSRQPREMRPASSNHAARADNTGPKGIHCEATTSASNPVDRKVSSDRCTPASADCTSSTVPLRRNSFAAERHSGSSTRRPSGPAFQAQDGPAAGEISSVSSTGGVGTYGGLDTMTSNGAQSKALIHEPWRTSTSTPASTALIREERTACGQMSKAVTLAQPNSAAAIATNPLPVQRSSTLRCRTRPDRRMVSTSKRESDCG